MNYPKAQVSEYKFENDKLQHEIKEEKRKFFDHKSKLKLSNKQIEMATADMKKLIIKEDQKQQAQLVGNKFVGGGFSLKNS